MKKSIYLVCLLMILVFVNACRDKSPTATVQHDQDSSVAVAAPVVLADTVRPVPAQAAVAEEEEKRPDYTDSVDFKKYAVEISPMSNAEIDWSSYPGAKTFKTRIIDGYNGKEINFAGHYIGIVFGCGGGCVLGFMVDVRDGKIYDLPLGEENMCVNMEDAALHRAGSRLFISAVCRDNEDSKRYYRGYLWDEADKRFNTVDEKEFVK